MEHPFKRPMVAPAAPQEAGATRARAELVVEVALPAASPVGEGARRTLIVVSFPKTYTPDQARTARSALCWGFRIDGMDGKTQARSNRSRMLTSAIPPVRD